MATKKLKLTVTLDPPLPDRKFILACPQKTIKELRIEIKRRLQSITQCPIILTLDGFELMDDDDVRDILYEMANINVKLRDPPSSKQPPQDTSSTLKSVPDNGPKVTISRKFHGGRQITANEALELMKKGCFPALAAYVDAGKASEAKLQDPQSSAGKLVEPESASGSSEVSSDSNSDSDM
ncbi:hypothetical protein GGI07_001916 [Coemansia sp. Benny D115]|nr:hypothetical protein GGI07_001916 [Coemansia sp. Benny D115]